MLSRVIARVLGLLIRTRGRNTVQSTPTAGPVSPEPTTPTGSNTSALTIPPFLRQSPAPQPSSKKKKPAQPTTRAKKGTSKKSPPVQTETSPPVRGNSTPTPVRKTRRLAKP
jgi:hypothetical protein